MMEEDFATKLFPCLQKQFDLRPPVLPVSGLSLSLMTSVCPNAAHTEAPGASFHVSLNSNCSPLSHTHKCSLLGSKADLLAPVFSLRAVLMVQWLKAVLMHHTSYLASVSPTHTRLRTQFLTAVTLDRCCFRPQPAGEIC